jgi:hypothetical protein
MWEEKIMTLHIQAHNEEGPLRLHPAHGENIWGRLSHLRWRTRWTTNATSGYIVQEVYTEIREENCSGQSQPVIWTRYWEAWQITGTNTFSPNAFDRWSITLGANRKGTWHKRGQVYIVAALDPAANFTPGGARDAFQLLSTYTQPRNLGTVLRTRGISGEYNTCGHLALWYHRPLSTPHGHHAVHSSGHGHHHATHPSGHGHHGSHP